MGNSVAIIMKINKFLFNMYCICCGTDMHHVPTFCDDVQIWNCDSPLWYTVCVAMSCCFYVLLLNRTYTPLVHYSGHLSA